MAKDYSDKYFENSKRIDNTTSFPQLQTQIWSTMLPLPLIPIAT